MNRVTAEAAASPRNIAVLAADSIGRLFGERRILTAATLSIPSGRVTALLGRNGCGKTTLMRILAGSLRPDAGQIRLNGRVVRPRLHRLAREGILFLPERGFLGPFATVREHFDRLAARWQIDPADAIERLDAGALIDRYAEQLSGGERRRVEVALAVARQPVCLLADEPLQGIAPRDVDIIAAALRALADAGCGVLVTGHEVPALLDLADEVVWMTAGTTHALGPPREAVRNHSFVLDYLGPYHGGTRVG